jgi:hypothetical protein
MIHPVISSWIVPVLLSFPGEPAGGPGSAGDQAPASVTGVRVEFPERKIAPEERNPEAERKAILGAVAVLKTDRPIRYRSVVLPPGSYTVTVAADEERGKNLFFVIGPKAGGGSAKPEDKKAEKDGAKAAGGAVQSGGGGGGEVKGGENGNGKGNGSGDGAGKGDGPRGRGRKTVSNQIRALFHLAPSKVAVDGVQFSIGNSARANRFALTVRAGSTEGKANLRLEG